MEVVINRDRESQIEKTIIYTLGDTVYKKIDRQLARIEEEVNKNM